MQRSAALALLLLALAASPAGADLSSRAAAELRLAELRAAGDEAGLWALRGDAKAPPIPRGKAFLAFFEGRRAPLAAQDRARLVKGLSDPSPAVRAASLRVIGRLNDREFEADALRRAAEDPDAGVRVEALQTLRPWTRQGHLYFIDQALGSSSPLVQAEALRNLAALPYREAPPEILGAVDAATSPLQPTGVRLAALEVLKAWGRLDWPQLKEVLLESEGSEALRLFAVEASDSLAPSQERNPILLDILGDDTSQRLAWKAFDRLRRSGADELALPSRVTGFLAFHNRRNTATEGMAAYLRGRGYRVEFRSGAWKLSRP